MASPGASNSLGNNKALIVDTSAPSAFNVGSVVTTGGTVVAGKWNATNTGINQLYSRGTDGNRNSNYGEYTGQDLGFNSAYYYRIKGQYLDRNNDIDYEKKTPISGMGGVKRTK